MARLTHSQIWNCIIVERSSASLSVASTLTLFLAFWRFPRLRTLSNTLIFFASFANLGANVAALIGGSALSRVNSGLCQFQGFLLEWLMQSDPLWGTCMAFNVYFVIFRRWEPRKLKKMYKWYFAICYGVPFIPAMFCLFYRTQKKGRVYGNATLWCWIDNDWQTIRIYSYYGPIWCYILITFLIYFRVGFEIFRKRSALKAFGSGGQTHSHYVTRSDQPSAIDKRNSWVGGQTSIDSQPSSSYSNAPKPFSGTRTTEFEVTHSQGSVISPAPSHVRHPRVQEPGNFVDITTSTKNKRRRTCFDLFRSFFSTIRERLNRIDRIKFAYSRCAFLFATSILITWVPASANRVYSLAHATNPSYSLNLAASAVLPLQGFWNTVIFFWTSWHVVKDEYRQWRMAKGTDVRKRDRTNFDTNIDMAERHVNPVHTDGGTGRSETDSTRQVLEDYDSEEDFTGGRGYTRSNSYIRASAEWPTSAA